ncbi:MAG: H-type small acid-soluble spore protein [Acetivibrionales bacterium]
MDIRRASEIMESHGIIDVHYKGQPVWMQGIKGDIAQVSYISNGKIVDVPLYALEESDENSD